jgi:hypothetical protein
MLADAEGWLEKDRETLFSALRRNYTDGENEAADVLFTRLDAF